MPELSYTLNKIYSNEAVIKKRKGTFIMNFYNSQKQFYCGVDLHARTMYICIIDKERNILVHKNLRNQNTDLFLQILKPYRHSLVVSAESGFAWYWLADLCADAGIEFILGHALYMKAIHGGKAKNDRIDSHKIALLTQGGMFPLAYVYPQEKRALRDLLRRRLHYVRIRADLFTHLQLTNYQANNLALGRITKAKRTELLARFTHPDILKSIEADLATIEHLDKLISTLEVHIRVKARNYYRKEFAILTSIQGVGDSIALTILLEIDAINRFPSHQHFSSYARLVKCTHESAGKKYGTGGAKIGNPYLKFAFSEAAVYTATYNPRIKSYLNKLENKHGKGKAKSVLAHKLGICVYHMLKNGTVFNIDTFLTH